MGFRIKEVRKEAGLTQEELAKLSGISKNLIARLESGNLTRTSTETLFKLARALNTKVEYIFFDKEV